MFYFDAPCSSIISGLIKIKEGPCPNDLDTDPLVSETIALCGTRCVIFDIQARSFTQVNSRRLQSQCLAITAFYKAPQKNILLETVTRSQLL